MLACGNQMRRESNLSIATGAGPDGTSPRSMPAHGLVSECQLLRQDG